MSDTTAADPVVAGALLRAARQKQGLHIGMLAASIKVAPAKLEALESGRFEELPDATFARALAQSVCRALKVDPTPVLALLPAPPTVALDRVERGLNAPFRDRPGRVDPTDWTVLRQPALWAVALLLVAAAAFVFVPVNWLAGMRWLRASTPPAALEPASAPMAIPASAVQGSAVEVVTTNATPLQEVPAASAASAPAAAVDPGRGLHVRALEATWVRVVDAQGQVLLQRLLPPGEVIDLDGAGPLQVRIGNAKGTELAWRGKPVDLPAATRDNVATLDLP